MADYATNYIAECYQKVRKLVMEAKAKRQPNFTHNVEIVAVGKTKPKSMILEAYETGIRHFGENYVAELFEKSNDKEILELCPDIKWHFIGTLQSNKVNKLLECPNLFMIETVDSVKLANMINRGITSVNRPVEVLIQVNASDEPTKGGVDGSQVFTLAAHIMENCPALKLSGLMTIGRADHDLAKGPNPDFQLLVAFRKRLCEIYDVEFFELSMGMSRDFEHAIELGTSYVRIGTKLFGSRVVIKVEPNIDE